MLVRLSKPRSPRRFFSWPMRALTKPWRSLANLYSAFSERSPWARATAISLGSSTLSSCSRVSISCCSFCLILANGSVMRNPRQRKMMRSPARPNSANNIIRGRETEVQGVSPTARRVIPELIGRYGVSVDRWAFGDFEFDGLGSGLAFGVADGHGVFRGFSRSNLEAAGVRGPDFAHRGIDSHGFCIRDVVAELGTFARVDGRGRKVQGTNGEFGAAKSLNASHVVGVLLFGGFDGIAFFDGAIRFPTGKEEEGDIDDDAQSSERGKEEGALEEGFDRLGGKIGVSHA